MVEIPLTGGARNAHQQFSVRLGGNVYDFSLNYISYTGEPAWSMDIHHDGFPLVLGAMLVPGCDVIAPYRADMGMLIFSGAPVTLDNLGIDNNLVWVES